MIVFHVEVLCHPIMVRVSVPKQLTLALLCQGKRQTWYNSTLASRRKRLTAHFEDLEQCYFSNKMSHITGNHEEENHVRSSLMRCSLSLKFDLGLSLAQTGY